MYLLTLLCIVIAHTQNIENENTIPKNDKGESIPKRKKKNKKFGKYGENKHGCWQKVFSQKEQKYKNLS